MDKLNGALTDYIKIKTISGISDNFGFFNLQLKSTENVLINVYGNSWVERIALNQESDYLIVCTDYLGNPVINTPVTFTVVYK